MWKFHNFSPTQILREINFGDSQSAKPGNFTNLEDLNFFVMNFYNFVRLKFTKLTISRALKMAKKAVLELLDHPKNDFT